MLVYFNMAMDDILHFFLPQTVLCQIFSEYLTVHDICSLDVAICNKIKRPLFLECIGSEACIWLGDDEKQFDSQGISYLCARNIKIRNLNCGEVSDEMAATISGFGIYLQRLKMKFVNDANMIIIVEGCPGIKELVILRYDDITADSIIKIADTCHAIESLDISYFNTDNSVIGSSLDGGMLSCYTEPKDITMPLYY